MAVQNLADPATILLRHFSGSLTNATNVSITNNSTSQTWLVKSCVLTNLDNQYEGEVQARVSFSPSSVFGVDLCRYVWIPFGTSLTIINDSLPIYLDYDQKLVIWNEQGINMNYNVSIATIAE